MDCVNCWGRYSHPERFRAPADILQRPCTEGSKLRPREDTLCAMLKFSFSLLALDILANLHNKLMHWDGARLIKIVAVILLDIAAFAVGAFAALEGLFRLVVGILLMPILPFFKGGCNFDVAFPAFTGVLTLLQIPSAARTIYQFSTSNQNVVPMVPFLGGI